MAEGYNKHTWQCEEIIDAEKLNNMENGIDQLSSYIGRASVALDDLNTMVDSNADAIESIRTTITQITERLTPLIVPLSKAPFGATVASPSVTTLTASEIQTALNQGRDVWLKEPYGQRLKVVSYGSDNIVVLDRAYSASDSMEVAQPCVYSLKNSYYTYPIEEIIK